MEITRPTYLEININNYIYNINKIKELVGNITLMPVIKANAYGTYINKRIDILNMFDIVAVATVDEGVELRQIGYNKEIFILNQPYKDEINKIIKNNITIGLSSIEFLEELIKINKKIKVHLEIETGMGRTGININNLNNFIDKLTPNIEVEGIYTHLSSADIDYNYTNEQLDIFKKAIDIVKRKTNLKYIHAAASNGIVNFKESYYNLVRVGIIMYGYPSADDTLHKIEIKPIAKLKSKIVFLKTVPKNTSISYGRSYITNKETKVATIPIGYADGFRRELSNKWYVLINNKKCPIIGKICMDSFMVDVTELDNVEVGDEVIIWDNENIKLEEIAAKCNTINYEILCTISNRVPRKFIKE